MEYLKDCDFKDDNLKDDNMEGDGDNDDDEEGDDDDEDFYLKTRKGWDSNSLVGPDDRDYIYAIIRNHIIYVLLCVIMYTIVCDYHIRNCGNHRDHTEPDDRLLGCDHIGGSGHIGDCKEASAAKIDLIHRC